MMRSVLVAGATGQQGGAVVRHLVKAGIHVRALTRSPDGARAQALAEQGVEVVGGDMNRPETLAGPLSGVDGVFSVQDFYAPGAGFEGEVRQGRNLVAAAAQAGVRHLVQSTMAHAPGAEDVEHFRSKFVIEQAVVESGLSHTFIGTVWFMDNLLSRRMGGLLSFPFLAGSLSADTPFEMLAVDDVGAVAARVFAEPTRFAGRRLDIAGDRLTVPRMKRIFRAETGRRPPPLFIPRWLARRLSAEFASQLAWQARSGWSFPLDAGRAVWPGMQTFVDFLATHRAAFRR